MEDESPSFLIHLLTVCSPVHLIYKLITWRRAEEKLSKEDLARLRRLNFGDYDEKDTLLEKENTDTTIDGYIFETVHDNVTAAGSTPGEEETDDGMEEDSISEFEMIDEGAIMVLSTEDIRKMKETPHAEFVRPPDAFNLELSESLSRHEQASFDMNTSLHSRDIAHNNQDSIKSASDCNVGNSI